MTRRRNSTDSEDVSRDKGKLTNSTLPLPMRRPLADEPREFRSSEPREFRSSGHPPTVASVQFRVQFRTPTNRRQRPVQDTHRPSPGREFRTPTDRRQRPVQVQFRTPTNRRQRPVQRPVQDTHRPSPASSSASSSGHPPTVQERPAWAQGLDILGRRAWLAAWTSVLASTPPPLFVLPRRSSRPPRPPPSASCQPSSASFQPPFSLLPGSSPAPEPVSFPRQTPHHPRGRPARSAGSSRESGR